MSNEIDIVIPTYNRPQAMDRIYQNIKDNTDVDHGIYFVIHPQDSASINHANEKGYKYLLHDGSYARCINHAFTWLDRDYMFTGADDLDFHKDWDTILLKDIKGFAVASPNDLHNPLGTHFLLDREYGEMMGFVADNKGIVMYPYNHNYCDTELVETAKSRKIFVNSGAIVEHLHWTFRRSENDDTYRKNAKTAEADRLMFESRRHLWSTQ